MGFIHPGYFENRIPVQRVELVQAQRDRRPGKKGQSDLDGLQRLLLGSAGFRHNGKITLWEK
jgi:hypothetical protein